MYIKANQNFTVGLSDEWALTPNPLCTEIMIDGISTDPEIFIMFYFSEVSNSKSTVPVEWENITQTNVCLVYSSPTAMSYHPSLEHSLY
jgi:hypothetical protein